MDRLTLQQAALRLGISESAVRKRYERGTLRGEKGEDGRVYVFLDEVETQGPAAVDLLQDQVAYLRRQLEEEREARRRADTIIAQLSQANAEQARTIRAIEAPDASPAPQKQGQGSPEPRPEGYGTPETRETNIEPRRPWWRRLIGG